MADLAIICPSRGRPDACRRMVESALHTSDVDVMLYLDLDDPELGRYGGHDPKHVTTLIAPPIGRGHAINILCQQYPRHACLLVSDDVTFVRKNWDIEVLAALASFGDDIGLVHLASENGMDHVNWPCVSRKWIDTLGWFNPPGLDFYCQDTVLSALAVSLNRVRYIEPQVIEHRVTRHPEAKERAERDFPRFVEYMAREFGKDLDKLRSAMR